jgi:hypothetical protein
VGVAAGVGPGDPATGPVGCGSASVERRGQLQDDEGATGAAVDEIGPQLGPHRGGAQPDLDVEACGAQHGQAGPGHLRVGVAEGDDHPTDPGGDDGVGAGGRAPVVRAGLEGDVEGRPGGRVPGGVEGDDLGVGAVTTVGGPDEAGVIGTALGHDDGADPWSRRHTATHPGRSRHRLSHPIDVTRRHGIPDVGARDDRHALAPIRTVTVGSGIAPDRLRRSTPGFAGSTAGRDFHPTPRGASVLYAAGVVAGNHDRKHLRPATRGRQAPRRAGGAVAPAAQGNRTWPTYR